ncbi:MAG: SRPBCC domain-containing protein [Ignavibacteriales bacterium]|nr:SRPBCC domain-containing protein [Ignavibacteriales bacterium]
MSNKINSTVKETEQKELVITRIFDAPRELVWKAWTEPERLARWWGPKSFPIAVNKLDLRSGGIFHYSMQASPDNVWWGRFVYQEVIPPEKLVFISSFSDEQCGVTRHPLSSTWPLETLTILTLSEENGKTLLTLRGYPINASEEERTTFESNFTSVQQGFKGTFEQLDEYLSTITKGSIK